eukprot:TRINITY_DN63187_c0_g1_i1.p2 TRINITY_DN63187_c0_g1~~TRINITY_DN63187_c0_g1_i1.p2  ORF type:complete len:133 (-),score=6.89 TRINITY_DN63187_c0_g1_i1:34-432(-)
MHLQRLLVQSLGEVEVLFQRRVALEEDSVLTDRSAWSKVANDGVVARHAWLVPEQQVVRTWGGQDQTAPPYPKEKVPNSVCHPVAQHGFGLFSSSSRKNTLYVRAPFQRFTQMQQEHNENAIVMTIFDPIQR